MAIDPVTAKILAQAAASAAANKESRKKLLYILLIAVVVLVVFLLMPLYLLTHPLEMLQAAFADTPDDAAFLEQYKQDNDDKVLVIADALPQEDAYPLPCKNAVVIDSYGEQTDSEGSTDFHYGTDFSSVWQSEIYAIADGEVVYVCTEPNNDYGNYLIIKHTGQRTDNAGKTVTETFYGLYAYMSEIYMFQGQSVQQGALIGLMGGDPRRDQNSGKSTQTHLHFEIRLTQNGTGVDPAGYIFQEPEPTPQVSPTARR